MLVLTPSKITNIIISYGPNTYQHHSKTPITVTPSPIVCQQQQIVSNGPKGHNAADRRETSSILQCSMAPYIPINYTPKKQGKFRKILMKKRRIGQIPVDNCMATRYPLFTPQETAEQTRIPGRCAISREMQHPCGPAPHKTPADGFSVHHEPPILSQKINCTAPLLDPKSHCMN